MNRLYVTLVSIWAWLVLAACILIWLPLMVLVRLVTAPFDPGRYWVGYLFRRIAVVHQTLNPLWKFRTSGTLPSDPRRPYVVVSNHESFVDILLISHLPWEMKWLSKIELFRIPFLGWLMSLAGDIPLERGRATSAARALIHCKDRLKKKVSVMIFPEGTRSTTGEMLPFKDGAFRLAVETGLPLLPLVLSGTGTALRKHDWRLGRSVAEVKVLPAIDTTGMTVADVPRLRDQVRELIQREHAIMRGRLPVALAD